MKKLSNTSIIVYILISAYTLTLFIISLKMHEKFSNNYFATLKNNHHIFFYGINTFFKSFFALGTSFLFLIAYEITKKRTKHQKIKYFYISQIFIFLLYGLDSRFYINEFLFHSQKSAYIILFIVEIALFVFLSEFSSYRGYQKTRIIIIVSLVITGFLFDTFLSNDDVLKRTFVQLIMFWINILFFIHAYDIVLKKIKKMRYAANKYWHLHKKMPQFKNNPDEKSIEND